MMDFDKELTAFKRMARKRHLCLQSRHGDRRPPFAFRATQAAWEAWEAKARRADAHLEAQATETADE